MAAAAGNAGWRAVIAARNTTVEKVVWHDERPRVAEPAARDGDPWGKLIGAITNATAHGTPIVTLEKAKACSCAYGIDARVKPITAYSQLP